MIVIKNVEIFEVDRNPIEILSTTLPHQHVFPCSGDPVSVEVFRELIRGRRFVRPSDGTDIVVGMSIQAEDVIGLQYEAWDEINNSLNYFRSSLAKSDSEIMRLKSARFWERFRWLFTGVKTPNKTLVSDGQTAGRRTA